MTNSKPWWIKFKPDVWEGGVVGLSPEAEYVYFRICKSIWSNGKPIFFEQIFSICNNFSNTNNHISELVRAGKINVSNGLINCRIAKSEHVSAKKLIIKNQKRTKNATNARKKQALTPGKERENPGNRDVIRDVGEVEKRREEKNIPSIHSEYQEYKNSNSQTNRSDELKNNGNSVGFLKASTYEQAKTVAPGYDVYYIESLWRDSGFADKAKKPDAAFLGFLKKHAERNPL